MNIIVIGGGAAGLMAAGTAAEQGAQVTLLETNEKVGRKLFITGKGRCNVCNNCDVQEVLRNVPVNPRFLYSALGGFGPADVMDFFENHGVALKTERGNRVFPQSDKAADIIDALFLWVKKAGVTIVHTTADELLIEDGVLTGVRAGHKTYKADRIIVATGGASYPQTGSTGDGYRFARQAGHTVVPANPSLVPLVEDGDTCQQLMGLSLRNVQLTVYENDKKLYIGTSAKCCSRTSVCPVRWCCPRVRICAISAAKSTVWRLISSLHWMKRRSISVCSRTLTSTRTAILSTRSVNCCPGK